MPLFTPSGSVNVYIDPKYYQYLNQGVRESTKEINRSYIDMEYQIGGGM